MTIVLSKVSWAFPRVCRSWTLGFLRRKLTPWTELRLEIYEYLLIPCGSEPQGIQIKMRYPTLWPIHMRVSGLVGSRRARHSQPFLSSWIPLGLSLAILRTCKKIHDEAATILYGKNDFHLTVPDRYTRETLSSTEPAGELWLRSQCLWLFGYREDAWDKLFYEIQFSLFARFLYKIGKENATRLRTLRISIEQKPMYQGENSLVIDQTTNVVMQLLKLHVPGLRDLIMVLDDSCPYCGFNHFDDNPVSDEEPNDSRRPRWASNPSVEAVLFDALKKEALKLASLKNLTFKGFRREPWASYELVRLRIVCRGR